MTRTRPIIRTLARVLAGGAALAALATVAHAAPPAWEVVDDDSRIVLFPTVHLLQEGLDWQTDKLAAEIEGAEEVWLEVADLDSPEVAAEMQRAVLERGVSETPLSARLSEDQNARLDALYAAYGMPAGALDPLQPWMAALTLLQGIFSAGGISPENGVETELEAGWGEREVRGLETAAGQIAMMAGLPEKTQVEMLMQTVDEADGMVAELRRITEAWAAGDTDPIEVELVEETRRLYPELFQALFADRNAAWVDTIAEEMAGAGTDFIAVGAGHLVGDDSVVDMLRERGFTVRRISLED